MIEIIKLEKPTKQGVTKQAKFDDVTIENPTVVNAAEKVLRENESLKKKIKRVNSIQQVITHISKESDNYTNGYTDAINEVIEYFKS